MVSAFLVLTAAALVQAQSAAQTDFLKQFAGIVNSQPACVGACVSSFDSTTDALTLTRHMCANAGQTAAFVATCVQRTGGCSGSDLAMGNAFVCAESC
ncbi:hypothetical protein BCR33DRAFT_506327 [Rhizoclosmatium globosum]|uniref:Extracellular membrane protein CFEM domain-containing protein n=1 Tax=Rhizoclosmatium globosum TaxID=329046 RepID=A0A1Y2BKH9_9FUNG|nr:hypothetical protein BCR33DRAFT_506327 [Rhizoclosmatium globosum]|eukprot:ORY35271.1 hypothetical protein BCR33DRAFT_506327 [Rhizoclosmatium globosum]